MHLCKFGYDESIFLPKKRTTRRTLRLVYVGRISPEKRINDIIEGIVRSQSKDRIHLTIVGHDPDPGQPHLKALEHQVLRGGVLCRFVGHVPHSRLAAFYHDADIFVNMRPDEAFGKVFVEAMATGLPVIGRVGSPGPEQLIKDGWNGFLVKTTDDLALFLDQLCRRHSLSAKLGRNALAFVRREYTYDVSYQSLAAGLDDLLAGYVADDRSDSTMRFVLARRVGRLLRNEA